MWKAQAGDWFVPSESTAGVFWHVRWLHPASGPSFYTCTCPHGRHRREMTMDALRDGRRLAAPCRHVRAALDADRANGQPPLSTAPPNIAALCD